MTTIDAAKRIATAVALTVAGTVALAPPAAASPRLALPPPSGPYAVGRDVLHLVDRDRRDPWVPENPRELMVSMFYPAAGPGRPARYLSTTEARLLIAERGATGLVEPEVVGGTRTAARESARPRPGRYPLVVLSPGFALHRHTLTHLAEELAGRGYVVAALDHAYESAGTAFPGGRVLTCAACLTDDEAKVVAGRAQDVTFLLDRLTDARPAWRHAGLIDRTRIGMAGHSIGGNAAAAAMAADRRVRAGVNMDGSFFQPVPAAGLDRRPFLMLGMPRHRPGDFDTTWDRDWPKLDGWKRWLTVTGTGHFDFSDVPVLAEQAGLPDPDFPLPGDRAARIVRDYVGAFFDLHLRGMPRPLLDGPTTANPEVLFHQPV
ncbi:hypothetical protein AB0F81_26135 [Actinoplanes sp. NPDC024001]|uniref:alpha/beta hydrolase family protein n=1 Tax=Actinoplanes sp. NPDC024001 TaxID=3154598 RepID=UPI0033F5975A